MHTPVPVPGQVSLSPAEIFSSLWQGIKSSGAGQQSVGYNILWQIRLPRLVMGAMVGASLAVSGAALQGLFRNPLVSSGMLGVSAGAGFGAALGIVLFKAHL